MTSQPSGRSARRRIALIRPLRAIGEQHRDDAGQQHARCHVIVNRQHVGPQARVAGGARNTDRSGRSRNRSSCAGQTGSAFHLLSAGDGPVALANIVDARRDFKRNRTSCPLPERLFIIGATPVQPGAGLTCGCRAGSPGSAGSHRSVPCAACGRAAASRPGCGSAARQPVEQVAEQRQPAAPLVVEIDQGPRRLLRVGRLAASPRAPWYSRRISRAPPGRSATASSA